MSILYFTCVYSWCAEVVMCGVGYHHAGLDTADRKMLETMFLSAELPVLCKYGSHYYVMQHTISCSFLNIQY